jgi:hypothetical protein
MEEVCNFIIWNRKPSIRFIPMDIEDLKNIDEIRKPRSDYLRNKLVKFLNPFSYEVKNKSIKIIEDGKEFDIIIYKNYWIITLYPR